MIITLMVEAGMEQAVPSWPWLHSLAALQDLLAGSDLEGRWQGDSLLTSSSSYTHFSLPFFPVTNKFRAHGPDSQYKSEGMEGDVARELENIHFIILLSLFMPCLKTSYPKTA